MHHKRLHDIAKFGAGLVAGDFLGVLWISNAGILPVEFFGRTFTEGIILPALIFDAALFLILVHYGWHIGKIPAIRERSYLMLAGIIFGIVAAAHLLRIFTGVEVTIATWSMPLWLSWLGTAITAYLSYMSLRLGMRMKH